LTTDAIHDRQALDHRIRRHLEAWRGRRPSREELMEAADAVTAFRKAKGIAGLWPDPPLMITATLDDAFGHGLEVIHRFGRAAGLRLLPLGTLQTAAAVADACRRHRPHLLGLTVLQFDTEADLIRLRGAIPCATRVVAGGPVFAADPDLAARAGIDHVARDAAAFWEFLLGFDPAADPPA
jgi:methylmalonyl-CoA mutase cobalamin-binding subunit